MISPRSKGGLRTWLRTWWETVPEPRELSLAWTALYVTYALTGLVVMIWPPRSLVGILDSRLSVTVLCSLLILGAAVSMLGGWREYWRLERVGLFLLGAATVLYIVITVILVARVPGARVMTLGYLAAAGLGLLIRYLMIRVYTYRPGSRPEKTGPIILPEVP